MSGCGGCSFQGHSTAVDDTFVGVRFGEETNLTLCRTDGRPFGKDERVIVELDDGPAYGRVEQSPMPIFKPCQKTSARRIVRPASDRDRGAYERKLKTEWTAKRYCRRRADELKLGMKISKVEMSLNGRQGTFYFTAAGRVDFRQLVRDLAQRFSTRVRMVQVGARDEAALLGGIGICGRTLCCSSWLTEFKPISIQMAKRQNLSLNPSKISGQCGRLLCCLAYEDPRYQRAPTRRGGKKRPSIRSTGPNAARRPEAGGRAPSEPPSPRPGSSSSSSIGRSRNRIALSRS
ncbi:MAG: regulatory iron-sulfur-containing complex subunit RicT [Acidobacteriota bacterium]